MKATSGHNYIKWTFKNCNTYCNLVETPHIFSNTLSLELLSYVIIFSIIQFRNLTWKETKIRSLLSQLETPSPPFFYATHKTSQCCFEYFVCVSNRSAVFPEFVYSSNCMTCSVQLEFDYMWNVLNAHLDGWPSRKKNMPSLLELLSALKNFHVTVVLMTPCICGHFYMCTPTVHTWIPFTPTQWSVFDTHHNI